jgi:moderate conductance mechanosensitive channel
MESMTPSLLVAAEDEILDMNAIVDQLAEADWLAVAGRGLGIIVVLVFAAVTSRYVRRAVRAWVSRSTARALEKPSDARSMRAELRAETLGAVMSDTARFLIWAIALVTALSLATIPVAPIIAGAGIAGIAIGFGAQSLVRDFFAGFFIILEDQFGVGDVIAVNPEVSGRVEEISLRMTRLRSLDGTVWFIPNGEIRQVGNRSKEWARALVDVEIAYGENVDDVVPVIQQIGRKLRADPELGPKILEDIEILGVEQLGSSGVVIRTYFKTLPLEQFTVARRLRQEVKRAFDDIGIEIPFPHRKIVFEDEHTRGARRSLGPAGQRRRPEHADLDDEA